MTQLRRVGGARKPQQKKNIGTFAGMTEAAAMAKAKKMGLSARVVVRDGKALMGDHMANPNRLNFTVAKGIVVGEPTRG